MTQVASGHVMGMLLLALNLRTTYAICQNRTYDFCSQTVSCHFCQSGASSLMFEVQLENEVERPTLMHRCFKILSDNPSNARTLDVTTYLPTKTIHLSLELQRHNHYMKFILVTRYSPSDIVLSFNSDCNG